MHETRHGQTHFRAIADEAGVCDGLREPVRLRRSTAASRLGSGLAGIAVVLLAACETSTAPSASRAGGAPSFESGAAESEDEPTTMIVGTGIAAVDVPAVQAAVDRGGEVVLTGEFSFDAPPTKPVATQLPSGGGIPPAAEVSIAKAVRISGAGEEGQAMPTIRGGTIPFYVDAPGQSVTIRGVRFADPEGTAIFVYAVRGLQIEGSRIDTVVPYHALAQGIAVANASSVPSPANPGHPENVSGPLRIVGNDIDMTGGASSVDNTLGVTVFGVGVPGAEVEAYVSENRIRNVTEPAINFRRLVGHADIEHNVISTGAAFGNAMRIQAIRVANLGSYHVAYNSVTCEWAVSDAEGIGVFSQVPAWHVQHALVEHNDIEMRAPAGTSFTTFSAGIGVYGFADSNVVRHNTIRGAALAAVSIPGVFPLAPQAPASPSYNAFIRNRFVRFTPSDSDIFVGDSAVATRVVGRGTIDDRGKGTIIVRH